MLENLIGAQILSIDETSIKVKLNDVVHTLEIEADPGNCCGFADFTTNLLYSENDFRNPIITNIKSEDEDDGYKTTSLITFYGEEKALATIESEAGSGSGWAYGATVNIRCKALDINADLASW